MPGIVLALCRASTQHHRNGGLRGIQGVFRILSDFLTSLCCAYGVAEPSLHHLHRAIDLGATTQQIAELRRFYRTVIEEPLLARLVAEEQALYQTARRKAQAMQRKYRRGNSWL
jgi:hypothetical protein